MMQTNFLGQCSADTGSGQRPVRRCDNPDHPAEQDRQDELVTRGRGAGAGDPEEAEGEVDLKRVGAGRSTGQMLGVTAPIVVGSVAVVVDEVQPALSGGCTGRGWIEVGTFGWRIYSVVGCPQCF
jgi:hypothetical protein